MNQLLPHITPVMLREQPDQVCFILNRLIDLENKNYVEIDRLRVGLDAANTQIDKINDLLGQVDGTLVSLDERVTALENAPPPTPAGEWEQVRAFSLARMGTTPGMCLQNCRLGFGISSGTFPTARADWLSQQANGTLHTSTPPIDVQVPVYCDTGVSAGHVVVWDRGTVYSDGTLIPQGLAYYSNVIGWGELCDGERVVQKI